MDDNFMRKAKEAYEIGQKPFSEAIKHIDERANEVLKSRARVLTKSPLKIENIEIGKEEPQIDRDGEAR